MQHTPVVRLPEEKRHNDLGLIIAVLAIIAIVVLVVVALARPELLTTEPAVTIYTNPEVSQAERYMAWQAESEAAAGPTNPELSSANRYQQLIAEGQFLRENPEIRRFLQSREDQ